MDEIARMQENLLLIRRTVGWTAEAFGERIGVTRQTINNIESGRSRLTKTQYIAMRSVLDAEMLQSPDEETEMLRLLLDALVDHPGNYSSEERPGSGKRPTCWLPPSWPARPPGPRSPNNGFGTWAPLPASAPVLCWERWASAWD